MKPRLRKCSAGWTVYADPWRFTGPTIKRAWAAYWNSNARHR